MPNNTIKSLTVEGVTYNIVDKTSGYATESYVNTQIGNLPEPMIFKGSLGTGGTITSLPAASSSNEGYTYKVITAGTYASQAAKVGDTFISDGSSWVLIPSGDEPSGTVTSVGVQNGTNGGLDISGSPITSSGTITIGHSNVLTSAQTTQAVYPIKIDKNGHISAYGSAVTIPEVPSTTGSATTGISISDHSTSTIYGVSSSTTSVTGVSGSTSVRGVKTGNSSTTTASHVKSGGNGTAPTLGTAISVTGVQSSTTSVRGVKTGTSSTTTASKVTLGTAISVPNPSASDVTVPIRADSDTTVPIKNTSATTVPIKATSATTVPIADASATSCDDITNWAAGSGSLTFTMDTTDTHKLIITHSHTAPTLSYTAKTVTGVTGSTSVYGVQESTTSVTGVQSSTTSVRGVKTGTSSTTTASKVTMGTAISVPNVTAATDVTVPIRADADTTVPIKDANATSIPNVTSVGSASNWVFEDVTVPIRDDSDTAVPIAAESATTVPIKDSTSTTVVTSKTHTVTDNGHTHSI